MNSRSTIYICCASAVILFLVGTLVGSRYERSKFLGFFSQIHSIRNAEQGYRYTAPFLGTDSPPATDIGVFTGLRSQIVDTAIAAEQKHELTDYGVYFQSLTSTFWFGINEDENFLPASLYKVPLALIVYKEIEDGVLSAQTRLMYTEAIDKENPAGATQTSLTVGASYTVQELLARMLVESDNGAKNLLGTTLNNSYVTTFWTLMNLGSPHPDEEIAARDYSFFFRVLYNSTYLNADDSETILGMMASSTYANALVSGVPSGVKVSHKWGLSNNPAAGAATQGEIELHDCGIVYAPSDPYILCIMTKGYDQQALNAFIAQVSKIVYNGSTTD